MTANGVSNEDVWIYHEKQEALLCGQHALNNLVQDSVFSAQSLATMAHQLDEMEMKYMEDNNEGGVQSKDYLQRLAEGSGNVDAHGNFSIQVLRVALKNMFNIALPNIRQEDVAGQEPTLMEGFICNKQAHWFAIRKINGRYWNLNSTIEKPESISHFNVATEIEKLIAQGYSVFCVTADQPLPPPCTSVEEMERRKNQQLDGLNGTWWKEADLLRGVATTSDNGGGDPWKNVGSGMRLDGKSTTSAMETDGLAGDWMQALTEEEQLQMAMAASLEAPAAPPASSSPTIPQVPVPAEPPAGKGTVRIQFRLPSNPRVVRRFLETDTVAVIYSFCQEKEGGKPMELRGGYPPKDLAGMAQQTIKEANLNGQSIQGRFL